MKKAYKLSALCLQFFMKIDELLGTNNYKKYVSRNMSVDHMLPLIGQVAHNIGLGLLIIDETQNIKKRGAEQIMNFFVHLINSGINLCLIGTPGAYDLFGKELRMTRCLTGNAEIIYNNMEYGDEFIYLLESLWKYQWTEKVIPYRNEFAEVFYEETQGISDLVVKLFVYTQQIAIGSCKEEISIGLVRKVAKERFRLLQPMIDAIRSGNPHRIAKYEDIRRIESEYSTLEKAKNETKREVLYCIRVTYFRGGYLTIKNEQRNRVLDTFPIKRKYAGEVINEIEKFERMYGDYYYDDPNGEQSDFKIPDDKLEDYYYYVRSSRNLLSSASMVNASFFRITRNIISYLEEIERLHKITPIHPYHSLDIMLSRVEYVSRVYEAVKEANEEAKRIDKSLDKLLE
ncbi:AAA family ATPase [Terribacillus sp. 7520-G]|uniref:AAA family ATPase n=1 Tax=Terribacillus sp. 7520-G TaxID=2025389 RepID=UPI000BA5EBFA|nr:AAA family ATPase [Terribacillus sp. 7520-G]PAD39541.1 hypothetical protein CHH53_04835 [Terribacillus sp. 7520-G]